MFIFCTSVHSVTYEHYICVFIRITECVASVKLLLTYYTTRCSVIQHVVCQQIQLLS